MNFRQRKTVLRLVLRKWYQWHEVATVGITDQSQAYFSLFYLLNTLLMERMNKATLLRKILPKE